MSTEEGDKNITNWDELFDKHQVTHDMVIKTTYDILRNAGYNYSYDDVEKEYYSGF